MSVPLLWYAPGLIPPVRHGGGVVSVYILTDDSFEQAPHSGAEAAGGLRLLEEHARDCAVLRKRLEQDRPAASTAPDPERDRKLRALGDIE